MGRPWTRDEIERLREYIKERPYGNPNYFKIAGELDRTTDSVRNKVFSLRKENRHDWLEDERIGFLDLESNHLKASIGELMSWAIKPLGSKEVAYMGWNRRDAIDINKLDRRIMKGLIKELSNYDLVVTYFGTGFDIKFMRTRAMILGLDGFPKLGMLKHWDAYYAVRGKMSLHSNRLAVATEALGIEGKTRLPFPVWRKARLGYPDAMDYVREHNIEDVKILEDLYHELLPYVQITRRSI